MKIYYIWDCDEKVIEEVFLSKVKAKQIWGERIKKYWFYSIQEMEVSK